MDAAEDVRTEFPVSRPKAWARIVMGWICAQSLLTLIPIAPGPVGIAGLALSGGGFAVWALSGVWLLRRQAPLVVIDGRGVRQGRAAIPWDDVVRWHVDPADRRPRLKLRSGRAVRLDPGASAATLTGLADALRTVRPDLEDEE